MIFIDEDSDDSEGEKAILIMKVIVKVSLLVIIKVISERNGKRLKIRSSLMKIVMIAKEKKAILIKKVSLLVIIKIIL